MKINLPRFLATALVLIVASLTSNYANAHGVTLKVHHALPPDSPFHTQFLLPWLAKLESESHGLLRFQVFPVGAPAQLYDKAKSGEVEIVWTSVSQHADRFPAFTVFNLPLGYRSAQGSSRALWEYVQAQNLTRSEFTGVRLLAVSIALKSDNPQALVETFVLAMNSATYKSLSEELRKVILDNSGANTSALLGKMADADDKGTTKDAKEAFPKLIDDKIKLLDSLGLSGKELIESARNFIAEFDTPK